MHAIPSNRYLRLAMIRSKRAKPRAPTDCSPLRFIS